MCRSIFVVYRLALVLWLVAGPRGYSAELIGDDSIGPDSAATDFNGGFAAVDGGSDTIGQPAVEIGQDGSSLLQSMRVIVHGHESFGSGLLLFNFFNYRLKVWTKADYLSGLNAETVVDLGVPIGVTLIQQDSSHVVPGVVFGEASFDPGSFSLPSYDFRFDLTAATLEDSTDLAFDEPLPAGDYILAFQSRHNAENGGLYVSLSTIGQGLTPYYHQNIGGANEHPRGILLGQPAPYEYRWGWNIFQSPVLPGDYDFDGDVDDDDYDKWRSEFGTTSFKSDGNDDGLVDAADYVVWRKHLGTMAAATSSSAATVPEPNAVALGVMSLLAFLRRPRR
jgi:hypothetical protein